MIDSAPGTLISCQEIVELVTDYLEGALTPDLTAQVRAHRDSCEGCAIYLEQIRTTLRLLGHVPVDSLSESARADLLDAFRGLRGRGGGQAT